jgi:hypothetical protein
MTTTETAPIIDVDQWFDPELVAEANRIAEELESIAARLKELGPRAVELVRGPLHEGAHRFVAALCGLPDPFHAADINEDGLYHLAFAISGAHRVQSALVEIGPKAASYYAELDLPEEVSK